MTLRSSALLLVAFSLAGKQVTAQEAGLNAARNYRQQHAAEILRDFGRLLSLPNVASDSVGIRRNAAYISTRLESLGVRTELLTLPGVPPIVFGKLDVPDASRTLGVYVHYDGQPVDANTWTHDPWSPALYSRAIAQGGTGVEMPAAGQTVDPEWRIYARSAGDDKAPLGAILPVLKALREANIQPTSNLRFFFEGEEEAGSRHLRQYLETYRDRIDDIDLWLFFDGPVHQSGRPQLAFGVRGVTSLEVTVYGAVRPLHSGHYGNWAPVPGQMLARLLASMKDETGKVLIDGFYDTAAPLGPEEQRALAELPDYDPQLKRELGLVHTEGEGQSLPERLLLPSLTVKGLASANVGSRARNVIPATATAALGVRLVKGNDPSHMLDLVEAHIRKQGYHIVRSDPDMTTRLKYPRIARVARGRGYPAARTSMALPIVQDVIRTARKAAPGNDLILFPTLGGSLPLYLFTDLLGKPAVVVPVANHDDNQHAADENLRIGNLWYAIDLYGALLTMP